MVQMEKPALRPLQGVVGCGIAKFGQDTVYGKPDFSFGNRQYPPHAVYVWLFAYICHFMSPMTVKFRMKL